MPDFTQTLVSAMEYEALLNLDRVLRVAMSVPGTGEFLATALEALDQVRMDQGLPIPDAVKPREPAESAVQRPTAQVSALAAGLIRKAMDDSKS